MNMSNGPSCNQYTWSCWLFHFTIRAAAGTVAVVLVRWMVGMGIL